MRPSFIDAAPPQHAQLSYVVRAVDTNGNETTPRPHDLSRPTGRRRRPPVLTVDRRRGTTAMLRWTAANDNVGVVGYDVLRDGAPGATHDRRGAHVHGRGT